MQNSIRDTMNQNFEVELQGCKSLKHNAAWRIEMLGGLRVLPPSGVTGAVTHFATRKTGALLAYLAYHRERVTHSRNALAELFWPDTESEKARANLRVSLNRLRKLFIEKGYDPDSFFHIDKFVIGLKHDRVVTDVACFEEPLQAAAGASTVATRMRFLCEAVETYQGALLCDYDEEWIASEARRLEDLFCEALCGLIDILEENNDIERALHYAYHAVSFAPWREEGHYHLIRLYLVQGQFEAARAHYKHYCKTLEKNFGSLPPESLQTLIEPHLKLKDKSERKHEALSAQRNSLLQNTYQANQQASSWTSRSITFLLIDRLFGANEESVPEAHRRAALRELIARHGGHEFGERRGDSIWASFSAAIDALTCALAIRQSVRGTLYEGCRMALDTGDGGLWANSKPDSGTNSRHAKQQNHHNAASSAISTSGEAGINRHTLDRALSLLQAGHAGQTLCSEVTGALLRRALEPGVVLDDLGVYRLHDALVPERIYQISYGALQVRQFPPLLAAPLHSSELPSSITTFFGRQHDLKKLETWLTPTPVTEVTENQNATASQKARPVFRRAPLRLVTLTGCGGCGKTRLALETAHRLQAAYGQAVWFVPLSGVRDPQLIIHAIVEALRLPGAPGLDPWLQVANELGQKSSLLVLDNFEQLHEGGVEVVKRLLDTIPTLSCLVTSRRTLIVKGEQEWPVSPLSLPLLMPSQPATESEAKKCRRHIRESESVRLFVDRARLARPSFELTPYADVVAQLCKLLGGLPLAIELVASHAHVLTPPQILSLIEPYTDPQLKQERESAPFDHLDFFHDKRSETPARHRSLRAAIRWSYDLLDAPLQKFFACLWVFKGGWTPEAAQFIATTDSGADEENTSCLTSADLSLGEASFENFIGGATFERLLQLEERSMILADERGAAIRFSLLDMLRSFAKEQLTEAECNTLEARHAAYFLHLAESASGELMGAGRETWLRRLDPEIDNLRAALSWMLRHQPRQCLQMTGALWRFWEARGLFGEGRDWLDRAFAAYAYADETIADKKPPVRAALSMGKQKSSALSSLHADLPLPLYLRALNGAGRLAWYRADFVAARRILGESLALVRSQNALPVSHAAPEYRHSVANALHSLALVAMCQGDRSARAMIEEGLNLVRIDGDPRVIKDFMLGLALVKFYLADNDLTGTGVRELLGEALEISQKLNDRRGVAFALNNLGMVEGSEKNYDAARHYHESSLPLLRDMGDKWSTARALAGLGRVAWFQGEIAIARDFYRENLIILRDLGSVWELVYTLEGFAWLALHQHNPQRAAYLLGAGDALREAAGHVLFPIARACYEECVAQTRAALSQDDQTGFESLRQRGRLLSREAAIAEALAK